MVTGCHFPRMPVFSPWASVPGRRRSPRPKRHRAPWSAEPRADRGENRAALMRRLRIAKRRVALLAAVAELSGSWSLEQQMSALSRFAEAAIGAAVRDVLRAAAANGAIAPIDPADPESGSGLIVLAMGKLGGGELNYSSDIDLILLYDPAS